jgi:bifunctional non-homologous end joining protein LigD
MESITLYYKQGSSDKVYQARIELKDGKYLVNYEYGRRGSTMAAGTKTVTAVDYGAAKGILEKLVKEKIAKGYTPCEYGTPYQHTDKTSTGIHCQLLNPIGDDQIEKLINDPAYWMQEKWDGRRLLIEKREDIIRGINRLGLAVAILQTIETSVAKCPLDLIIDGECIGDILCVFDVLLIGSDKLGDSSYGERYLRLMNLLASFQHRHINLVETHFTTGQKREAFKRMQFEGCEGVVFKHTHAPYVAGRPASGGPQLKCKFCETASFIVGKVNGKRSVSLQLLDDGKLVAAGNVTIPPNLTIPAVDQVVECRYLYAFRESGSIFQPVYLGVRDDITTEECTTAQLKYKAAVQEVA